MSELLNAVSAKVCFHHELKLGSIFERRIYSTDTKNSKRWPQNNIQDGKNARCERHSINAMPGFQPGHSCFEEAQRHCHDLSEVENYDITTASDS